MKKWYNSINIVLILVAMILFSCGRSVSNKDNRELSQDSENISDIEFLALENYYFIPVAIEVFLFNYQISRKEFFLKLLNESNEQGHLAYQFFNENQLDVRDELRKYLERKRTYDKSAIFSEVP